MFIFVLIDTQWNVNSNVYAANENASLVLIDTQWNVNNAHDIPRHLAKVVLIDTQWNVNHGVVIGNTGSGKF